MKCVAVLLSAVLAFVSSTHAAECSQEQLAAANSGDMLEKLQSACASAMSLASTASMDPQGAAKKICQDKPCMATIESMMNNQPDCTILGVNFKTKYMSQFSTIQTACKTLGAPVGTSSPSSASSTTAPTAVPTSSASAAALGLSATIAAAAVVAQL